MNQFILPDWCIPRASSIGDRTINLHNQTAVLLSTYRKFLDDHEKQSKLMAGHWKHTVELRDSKFSPQEVEKRMALQDQLVPLILQQTKLMEWMLTTGVVWRDGIYDLAKGLESKFYRIETEKLSKEEITTLFDALETDFELHNRHYLELAQKTEEVYALQHQLKQYFKFEVN